MQKPATFIALPMSINPRKWYLVYLFMLIYFKIVILSVTLQQSITMHKHLRFRRLRQKVILWVFCSKLFLKRVLHVAHNNDEACLVKQLKRKKREWLCFALLSLVVFDKCQCSP